MPTVAELTAEWTAVKGAPYLTIIVLALMVVIVWTVLYFLFKRSNDQLKADVESGEREVARLRGRIAEYESKVGATPDEAHAKLERLEKMLAGRRLTSSQKNKLVADLSSQSGLIAIQYVSGTPDGLRYQRDFVEVFEKSGWNLTGGVLLGGTDSPHGLVITHSGKSAHGQAVIAALSAANIDFDVIVDPSRVGPTINVLMLICPTRD